MSTLASSFPMTIQLCGETHSPSSFRNEKEGLEELGPGTGPLRNGMEAVGDMCEGP
jgi:hypothetical protein